MKNIKTEDKKEEWKDYPTYEEYIKNIQQIRKEELKSDRYLFAYNFLKKYYWNRENRQLEKQLFHIIEAYDLNEEESMPDYYQKSIRLKKFEKLKKFIAELTEEQIDSNIFLNKAASFIETSMNDCAFLINRLHEKVKEEDESETIMIRYTLPSNQKDSIDFISTQVGIKSYRPEICPIEYVDVLDDNHQLVYEEYNDCVRKIRKIKEDIYFLRLTDMTTPFFSHLICQNFRLYRIENAQQLTASFLVKSQEELSSSRDQFIQTTIKNFQLLLDMGLVDESVLNRPNPSSNKELVLKKTQH